MWSLPDIHEMNARKAEHKSDYLQQVSEPEENTCDACDKPAKYAELYYDIFSADPAGVSFACEDHIDGMDEGFFICETCGRRMIENITWERYEVGGDCLKCAAETYFNDPDNWIHPGTVKQIIKEPRKSLFTDGVLNLFATAHVRGVEQPLPEGFENVPEGYATYDSMDGYQIDSHDFETQIMNIKEPFLLIMDGAFQFAVRLGLYRRTAGYRARNRNTKRQR
jgi:hypothetical protein